MDDILFQKWFRWIEIIHKEIRRNLLWNRHIFRKVREIIKNNPKMPKQNKFYEFLGDAYGTLALMGIRRQVKSKKDSISLAGLLEEIYKNPEILSRKRFVNLYKEIREDENVASKDFDDLVGKGRSYVNPDQVCSDLDELRQKSKKIETIVDKRLAHYDKGAININNITFKEIDECIDFLEDLLKRCYYLIRAVDKKHVLPEFPSDDWMAIFREPWMP